MSFVKQLRDLAQSLPLDDRRRPLLQQTADQLKTAAKTFASEITHYNAIRINELWAVGTRLINLVDSDPPSGGGGSVDMRETTENIANRRAA
jgi:hypothetical protein